MTCPLPRQAGSKSPFALCGLCLTLAMLLPRASVAADPADVLPPVTQPAGRVPLSDQLSIPVTAFRIEGNTVIPTPELKAVLKKYAGRYLTMEDLEQARVDLTNVYVARGYINSGAVLPDQDADGGVILFRIIEGRLTEVRIHEAGDKPRFRPSYLRDRVAPMAKKPLNVVQLKERLEVLREDPNVKRINAEVRPGAEPGSASLDVDVAAVNPWQFGLQFNNHRPPSVGAERIYALGSNSNLTGRGDRIAARYAITSGGFDDMQLAGADDYAVDYALPLNASDTTLMLGFSRSDDTVVEAPFSDLGIGSDTSSLSLGVRQPVYRRPGRELAMSLSLARRWSQTTIGGEAFSFSPGAEDGRTDVTALRFGQEFVGRTPKAALALRSTFSIGLDALGSTRTIDGDFDSRFFAWLGQAQYARRMAGTEASAVFRASAQLAGEPLPPIEQFSIGGVDTVRGYRENRLVRDNGLAGSVELHLPVVRRGERTVLELVPFFDAGYGEDNNSAFVNESEFISSLGLGVVYNPNAHFVVQVYYGHPFKNFEDSDDDIQDIGLHFDVLMLAF